jgi:phosphate transport system substrate-binding protein
MRGFNLVHSTAAAAGAAVLISFSAVGCSGGSSSGEGLTGTVVIDGSSTVTPIMEAISEEMMLENPNANIAMGTSGTGGGFKKFIAGETDITMASRPIKDSENEKLIAGEIDFVEIPCAFDGLTVVINPDNDWATNLTVAELNKIWEPGSTVQNWNQVREGFPDMPLSLYGPGTDSGTFDYFTEVINGEGGASRSDYSASEDDNVLVQGVAGQKGALGYFGFAYYEENKGKLAAVAIDGGSGPVLPTMDTIKSGEYSPLSRPLFIYVRVDKADANPTVAAVVDFLLGDGSELVDEVGYVSIPQNFLDMIQVHFDERVSGSRFSGHTEGKTFEEILSS